MGRDRLPKKTKAKHTMLGLCAAAKVEPRLYAFSDLRALRESEVGSSSGSTGTVPSMRPRIARPMSDACLSHAAFAASFVRFCAVVPVFTRASVDFIRSFSDRL